MREMLALKVDVFWYSFNTMDSVFKTVAEIGSVVKPPAISAAGIMLSQKASSFLPMLADG
jgi:hypothetical protein